MRSVYGINGMHADGSKATGFRSMVVAQFTAISLQKDDRAFVKYNEQARRYDGINIDTAVRGAELILTIIIYQYINSLSSRSPGNLSSRLGHYSYQDE